MSNIKGQNLRLFINGKCVAAATSCQLHIGTEFQDCSTKDDADAEWQHQIMTKLNWDISADAMVEVSGRDTQKGTTSETMGAYYVVNNLIDIAPGEIIHAECADTPLVILDEDANLLASGEGVVDYANSGTESINVYVGTDDSEIEIAYSTIILNFKAFADHLINERDVTARLSAATGTTEGLQYFSGKVKVNDVSVSAQVDNLATYSVQMTGVGELSVV